MRRVLAAFSLFGALGCASGRTAVLCNAPAGQGCAADCPRDVGIHDHIRWPHKSVIEGRMLPF